MKKPLEERIRDAMTSEESLPRNELWAAVADRRQAQERVALPTEPKGRPGRVLAIGGLAAAGLLALMPLFERRPAEQPLTSTRDLPRPPKEGSFLLPGSLMAQASATPAFAASRVNGADRRPGRWTHGRYEHGELRETFSYELSRSTYQAAPAWLMISTMNRANRSWNMNDTIWASLDSMQPMLRIAHTGDARIEQTYRKDDILTGITRNGYTSWSTIQQRDPSLGFGGGVLFRPGEISMRLMAMDLTDDWKGSIPLPASGEQGIPSLWLNLAVDGSERITVPAGTFDSWRIRTAFKQRPLEPYDPAHPHPGIYFWISKDRNWLIQMSLVGSDRVPDDTPLVLLKGEQE